ncbi:SAC3 family protein C [Linum grandiflorum]
MERDNNRHYQRQGPPFPSSSSSRNSTNISRFERGSATASTRRADSRNVQESKWKPRKQSATNPNTLNGKPNGTAGEEGSSGHLTLIGTCPFMCPEGERAQRERLRDLAVFERLHGNPAKSSASLAVKKFCRTISTIQGKESDLRPLPVLEETLTYLLTLSDSTNHSFEAVHDFIFDRTRSIRQDLSMQNIMNNKAIDMYEKMVKFHVISHLKLRHRSAPITSSTHYLNMEQLTKAITSLHNLYDVNRDNSNLVHKSEAEFRSLYILLHIDSINQPTGESLALWFRRIPRSIIQSKEMCFARRVLRSFRLGNYKHFLSTVAAEASCLQYCILEPYINEVRAFALSCINNVCYKVHPYPLDRLSNVLIMKEAEVELLCKACGLETFTDENGKKWLPMKQATFTSPKDGRSFPVLGLEPFEK